MIIASANRLNQTSEYYFSRKLKEVRALAAAGKPIINMGIGSPDLAPPPHVIKALTSSLVDGPAHQYQSYKGLPQLTEAMADFYQKRYEVMLNPEDEILPLMGSKEGIMHISMAFLNPEDEVLIPNPGYPTYTSVTRLVEAEPVYYNLDASNNWMPDYSALEKRDLSKVKLMWVNYPHMPTGAKATTADFEKLVAFAKANEILLVNDNPYSFILNENPQSILSVAGAKEVAIELNSLSKSFNMSGWRVGMLLGAADYVSTVLTVKSNMPIYEYGTGEQRVAPVLYNPSGASQTAHSGDEIYIDCKPTGNEGKEVITLEEKPGMIGDEVKRIIAMVLKFLVAIIVVKLIWSMPKLLAKKGGSSSNSSSPPPPPSTNTS